jgi:hypothetical protein
MRSQPEAQQGPESFQGVDMDFMKTISIFIPSILATQLDRLFLPQFLLAIGWASPGHRRLPDPTPLQSVHSKGSSPSSTGTAPRPATVDGALPGSCHSDRQIVVHTLDIDIVGDELDAYGNHVC